MKVYVGGNIRRVFGAGKVVDVGFISICMGGLDLDWLK